MRGGGIAMNVCGWICFWVVGKRGSDTPYGQASSQTTSHSKKQRKDTAMNRNKTISISSMVSVSPH